MTLEERVERLENFAGDIDKIVSVYANSVQEICDKYLNLLYIETYDSNHPNYMCIDGFLSELTTVADLPKNVMFNIRASHTFAYDGEDHSSKIRFTRTDTDGTIHRLDVPLKKYDVANPGNLMPLEPGDYLQGILYGVYINSQGIAIISSNDSGTVALQAVEQIRTVVNELEDTVEEMTSTQTVGSMDVTNATIGTLTISEALTYAKPITLYAGSTCSNPTNNNQVANKGYVDTTIDSKIAEYMNSHFLFDTRDPSVVLQSAEERAVYFKYGD